MTPEQLTTIILLIIGIGSLGMLFVQCSYWRAKAKFKDSLFQEAMEGWEESLKTWRKHTPKLPPNVPVTPISDERAAVRQMR